LRRAIAILRLLAAGQDEGVRLTDMVRYTGLSVPTVHRLLQVLCDEGIAEQDWHSRRYLIGKEGVLLGLARSAQFPLRAIAQPFLQQLVAEVGETAFLAVRHGRDSVCIDCQVGTLPNKTLAYRVGTRRPLGVSVGGVVLLAALEPQEQDEVLAANQPRYRSYGYTCDDIRQRVEFARDHGYAYFERGILSRTSSIGMPLLDSRGLTLATVTVVAPMERLVPAAVPGVLEAMTRQIQAMAARFEPVAALSILSAR
jgi:DNA-binding IclR family transcriptional regulator